MVPAYANIAHYRAPYKNAVFAGFGDEPAAPTPLTKGELEALHYAIIKERAEVKDDYVAWKPETRKMIMAELDKYMGISQMTADGGLMFVLVPYNATQLEMLKKGGVDADKLKAQGAKAFVETAVAGGTASKKVPAVVLASPAMGTDPYHGSWAWGGQAFMVAYPEKESAATWKQNSQAMPVLAHPADRGLLASIGLGGAALIALAAGFFIVAKTVKGKTKS